MSTAVAVPPSTHRSPSLSGPEPDRRRVSRSPKSHNPNPPTAAASTTPQKANMTPANRIAIDARHSRSPHGENAGLQQETPRSHSNHARRSSDSRSPLNRNPDTAHSSGSGPNIPTIKKERAASPEGHATGSASARHRPRRLDLTNSRSTNPNINAPRPSAPLTSKDALLDVGYACLSPGFQTQDPAMQQQLAKSIDLREQQRQIIEARLNKTAKDGTGHHDALARGPGSLDGPLASATFPKAAGSSKRKGPPPGLAITAPSPQRFAHERAIQSAPLNQTFTGLKPNHPLSRQLLDPHALSGSGPTNASTSHGLAPHTANRLPPIHDVLPHEGLGSARGPLPMSPSRPNLQRSNSGPNHPGSALPSPGLRPMPNAAPHAGPHAHSSAMPQHNDRDFRSAEEALHSLSGGREDLLPKQVHYNGQAPGSSSHDRAPTAHQSYYGGHQPPTPPSPLPPGSHSQPGAPLNQSSHPQTYLTPQQSGTRPLAATSAGYPGSSATASSSRRRGRDEYERDLDRRDSAEAARRNGPALPFGSFFREGRERDSPETMRLKRERWLQIAEEAWNLWHS